MLESLLDLSTQRKRVPLHHIHIITPLQTSLSSASISVDKHTKPNNDNLRYFFQRLDFSLVTAYCTLYLLRVIVRTFVTGGVYIGARALLDINLIWFSYIAQ
jgi:hypothetical protein